ncbi:MAG: hypothetical protein ACOX7R_01000 [Acetivibrionales bacterium]|jgi:hypothetical protein
MKDEKKYKEEMDKHMSHAPQMAGASDMPQAQHESALPQMYQMPQVQQMPYAAGMPQMPIMCCPYLMNMQCPMMQNPYSANPYMGNYPMGSYHGSYYPMGGMQY